jgi:hypothetical protein
VFDAPTGHRIKAASTWPDVIELTDRRAEWIVCGGELRPVSLSRVQCPRGGLPAVETCLRCHWLEDADGDRSDVSGCHTPELRLASGGEAAHGPR